MSERKPVGSTRTDKDSIIDLIGDDSASPATARASSGPSTQDLLADIFGGSDASGSAATGAPSAGAAAPARSANADILSLFDSSPSPASASAPAPQPSGNALFDLGTASASSSSAAPAPAAAAPAPARAQLQSYTAYEKNGLKITLTPKAAPGQAGVVQVLARFTAQDQVDGVNFQVAVPKVGRRGSIIGYRC